LQGRALLRGAAGQAPVTAARMVSPAPLGALTPSGLFFGSNPYDTTILMPKLDSSQQSCLRMSADITIGY